jgi:hypothetical protein
MFFFDRRSSGALASKLSTASQPSTSKEGSPEITSGRYDNKDTSSGITFNVTDSDMSGATGSPVRGGTPSRKSTDSSDSQKGFEQSMDLGEKSFETSLNNILNKYSETSLDVTTDGKDDSKKSNRKKKSTPWYTVNKPCIYSLVQNHVSFYNDLYI